MLGLAELRHCSRVSDLARALRHTLAAATLIVSGSACTVSNSALEASDARSSSVPRIVTLHDMTSEILVALGAQETLVGAAPLVDGGPEVVAACANVPKVGGLESIALAKPDLVVAYAIVERSEPHLFAALRDQGIEVRIFDPQTPEEIIETIRELGQLSGRAQVAQRLVADFAARLNALAGLLHGKRYFVFDCCDPPLSAGRRSSLASALQHAGAVNIFADLDVQWSRVAWEEVWRRRPEFIILTDYEASSTAAKRLVLRRDPVLAELPIVTLNLREALAGPQLIHGIEKVVATIGGPA